MPALSTLLGPCGCCGPDVNGCGPANACAGFTGAGWYRQYGPGLLVHNNIGGGFSSVPQSTYPHNVSDGMLLRGPYPSAEIASLCDPQCTAVLTGPVTRPGSGLDAYYRTYTLPTDWLGPWMVASNLVPPDSVTEAGEPGSGPYNVAFTAWFNSLGPEALAVLQVELEHVSGAVTTVSYRWDVGSGYNYPFGATLGYEGGWRLYYDQNTGAGPLIQFGPGIGESGSAAYYPTGGVSLYAQSVKPPGMVRAAAPGWVASAPLLEPDGFVKLRSVYLLANAQMNGAYWKDLCIFAGGCGGQFGPSTSRSGTICGTARPGVLVATVQYATDASLGSGTPWTTLGSGVLGWYYGIDEQYYRGVAANLANGYRVWARVGADAGFGILYAFVENRGVYLSYPSTDCGTGVISFGYLTTGGSTSQITDDRLGLAPLGLIPDATTPYYVRIVVTL
jgi:hypothetical protein